MSLSFCDSENSHCEDDYRRSVNIFITYDDEDMDVVMEQYGCISFCNHEFLWKWPNKAITTHHNKCISTMNKVCIVLVDNKTAKNRYVSKKFLSVLGNIMRDGNTTYTKKGLTNSDILALHDIINNINFCEYNRYLTIIKEYNGGRALKITLDYDKDDEVYCIMDVFKPEVSAEDNCQVYTIDGKPYYDSE